MFSNFQK
jgi:PAS domain-containing protein